MRVGVFTALLAQMPLDGVIAKLKGLGIATVELGTGNYPGDPHCKLSMLEDKAVRKEFKQKLDDSGITISALSCHGNPLHPNREIAKKNQEVNQKTIRLYWSIGGGPSNTVGAATFLPITSPPSCVNGKERPSPVFPEHCRQRIQN